MKRKGRYFRILLAAAAACLSPVIALADADKPASPGMEGTAESKDDSTKKNDESSVFVIFQLENDLFSGTDRHYTNGMRLSGIWRKGKEPELSKWPKELLSEVSQIDEKDENRHFGLAIGQYMFTPEEREYSALIPDDRPYAAWLYVGPSLHTEKKCFGGLDCLDSVELDVGVVGPMALGREAQDLIHNLRLIERFNGWDNQLKNEPAFVMMWERKWRYKPREIFPLAFDAIPHVGGSLGTVLTHVNTGAAFRFGYNIPDDYGPPSIIKSVTTLNFDAYPDEKFGIYLFATAEGRAVARNIFLDGNTFADSHSVSKKPFVADLSLGVAVTIGGFKISYANVLRTREFDGQKENARFGSVGISFHKKF